MWSKNTNNIIGGIIAAFWLMVASNYIGDLLITPFEPVNVATASTGDVKAASAKKPAIPEVPSEPLPVLLAAASADKGKKVAKKCVACHSFKKGGRNKVGPNLFGIMGGDRAAAAGYNYSKAIIKMAGKWGYEDMNAFLAKPSNFMPKTKMRFAGLKKPGDRAAMILYLRSFADTPMALPE
jgi:cytochrome c